MSKEKRKPARIVFSVLGWIVFAAALFAVFGSVWNLVDLKANNGQNPFLGNRYTTITSESMATKHPLNEDELDNYDRIQKYDVVVSSPVKDWNDLKKYDVIIYNTEQYGLVCHRVIDLSVAPDGTKMVVTRGDANNILDGAFSFNAVVGKVHKVIPKVGIAVDFVKSPWFLLGVSVSVAAICVGVFIADHNSEKKEKLAIATESKIPGEPINKPAQTPVKPVSTQTAKPQAKAVSNDKKKEDKSDVEI